MEYGGLKFEISPMNVMHLGTWSSVRGFGGKILRLSLDWGTMSLVGGFSSAFCASVYSSKCELSVNPVSMSFLCHHGV